MASKSELIYLVDLVLKDKVIMESEWELLIELIHADGKLDDEERTQLSRIHALVSSGEITVKNGERDNPREPH